MCVVGWVGASKRHCMPNSLVPHLGGDFYSVVLLTDDRNLRVKALANSLPVKDMAAFMLMAKLPL